MIDTSKRAFGLDEEKSEMVHRSRFRMGEDELQRFAFLKEKRDKKLQRVRVWVTKG